jgi:hypothetical protein
MQVEVVGVAGKETRGMLTRAVFKLSRAPDRHWCETFLHCTGVQVTHYPRSRFEFDKDTVACSFMGPRLSEAFETLKLYVADANKKVADADARGHTRSDQRATEDEKRRQTETLRRELFDDK